MIKRNGATGSPYLSPLLGLNSFVGLPLTRTEIVAEARQVLIHLIHL